MQQQQAQCWVHKHNGLCVLIKTLPKSSQDIKGQGATRKKEQQFVFYPGTVEQKQKVRYNPEECKEKKALFLKQSLLKIKFLPLQESNGYTRRKYLLDLQFVANVKVVEGYKFEVHTKPVVHRKNEQILPTYVRLV